MVIALPFALVIAVFLISVLELIHIPNAVLKQNPDYIWKIPLLAMDGAMLHFRYHLIYVIHLSLLLLLFHHKKMVLLALGSAWTVAVTAYTYTVLTSYVRFQGYWPFVALFAAAGVFLSASFAGMTAQKSKMTEHIRTKILWWAHPIGFIVLGILMHVANFIVFPNVYPTLHVTLLQFTLVVFTTGLALATVRIPRRTFLSSKAQWITIAVFAHLFFLSTSFGQEEAIQQANPVYERYSMMGQANMVNRDIQSQDNVEAMNVTADHFHFDDFNRMSGLPELPTTMRLKDYNILLVTVESLRYDQTSLYRPKWGTTPTLEKLVKDGAYTFNLAFSPSMKTMISLSAILSMTYPSFSQLSLKRNPAFGRLRNEETTVAELLKDNGYQTFRVSHNFAHVFSRLNHGFEQGFDRNKLICTNPRLKNCDFDIVNAAISDIDLSIKNRHPFFGWVFLSSPHAFYLSHYADMPEDTDIERFRQEIKYADSQLARLLAHLKKQKLDKSTIVIVMGDHGEEFKEHGRTQHNSIYMENTNVALVVSIPGVKGQRERNATSTAYVFPWLFQTGNSALRAAAYKRVKNDFGPMMKTLNGAIISELLGTQRSAVAILDGDLRIHFDYASNYYEMFNIKKDRNERHNIFNEKDESSKRMQELVRKYKAVRKAKERVTFDR